MKILTDEQLLLLQTIEHYRDPAFEWVPIHATTRIALEHMPTGLVTLDTNAGTVAFTALGKAVLTAAPYLRG